MKILVIGSGGREHSIIRKLSESRHDPKLYCAPGNGGISQTATCVPIKVDEIDKVIAFAKSESIDMVMVAPDNPLVDGMVDALENAGIRAFGPCKKAAALEGSKVFSKNLMKKYNIPTAGYEVFSDPKAALDYIISQNTYPVVIKADGLAFGKGVILPVCESEARDAICSIMEEKAFGESGSLVVVEEFLTGPEVSVLAFTDGKTVVPMVSAQDHKRIFDNDQGPNTGGMGTFSPSMYYTDEIAAICAKTIFEPTINALISENIKYKGVIYFGLMLTKDGPKVIEYNARFGDPETQVVLPRLKTDLIDIFNAVIDEKLSDITVEWDDNATVCVVVASEGYPGKYKNGFEIQGLDQTQSMTNVHIIHAGTTCESGKFYTNGGRVLGLCAVSANMSEAISLAYKAVEKINFNGSKAHYRTDIGIR